jgi:eukaryotic-like serine/threonine-protein kinase
MSFDDDIPRIDLTGHAPRPMRPERRWTQLATGKNDATLDDLKNNYSRILAERAIYYPVTFQFVSELGRGRQGRVFLARRYGARGCVTEHAIKVFDPDLYRSASEYWTDMGRIATQLAALHRLQAPSMVSRQMYEEAHGVGYIQMEVIDGIDLQRLLDPAHLEVARARSSEPEWRTFTSALFRIEDDHLSLQPGVAVYILRHVLRSLERLHTVNFLHYDIKPANIMIDRLGNVKVIDFGRAVLVGETVSFLLGSPMYMAPETHERVRGTPGTDLYSLGLVALEMMRGRPLTEEDGATEDALLRIKRTLPEQLAALLPPHVATNAALVNTFGRLLALDPARRFASAKEAEVGRYGLNVIEKQLVRAGLDSEYERDLSAYLGKLVDSRTDRVAVPAAVAAAGALES